MDCKSCDDCGLEGLPYSKEWNKNRFSERIPTDERMTRSDMNANNDAVRIESAPVKSKRSREMSGTTLSDGEPRQQHPFLDKIKKLKDHVKGQQKNLYPGPLTGGEVPTADYGNMRSTWQPPQQERIHDYKHVQGGHVPGGHIPGDINDINEQMFSQYRNPMSSTSRAGQGTAHQEIYPDPTGMTLPQQPYVPQGVNQYDPTYGGQYAPMAPQFHGQAPGYPPYHPPGPYGPGLSPWQQRYPHYQNGYNPYMHPSHTPYMPPPTGPHGAPQPPPGIGDPNMSQGCPMRPSGTASESCPMNLTNPLPAGNDPQPVTRSSSGKTRPAPLPPGTQRSSMRSLHPDTSLIRQEMERHVPIEQVSLYPTIDEPLASFAEPNLKRSYNRKGSMRSAGGSMRSRGSINRVRFAEQNDRNQENVLVKIGDNINTLVKSADNPASIVNPINPNETLSHFNAGLTTDHIPTLRKGEHISVLAQPNMNTIQRGQTVGDAIRTAPSPIPGPIEDVRYPNLRTMSEAIYPTADEAGYYPNLHELEQSQENFARTRGRMSLRDRVKQKESLVEEKELDTDDEIEQYTSKIAKEIMKSRRNSASIAEELPTKHDEIDIKKQLALEIKDAIENKRLIRGDLRKLKGGYRPSRARSEERNKSRQRNHGGESGVRSDDDWWGRRGRRRLIPIPFNKMRPGDNEGYDSDSESEVSSESTSSSSDDESSHASSFSSVDATDEKYIMEKIKLYLANKKKRERDTVVDEITGEFERRRPRNGYYESTSEDDQDVVGEMKKKGSLPGSLKSLLSNDEGLTESIAAHFRKGSTKLKRSIADTLMNRRKERGVAKPDHSVLEHLRPEPFKDTLDEHILNPHNKDHTIWDHLTQRRLDDDWTDHLDNKTKSKKAHHRFVNHDIMDHLKKPGVKQLYDHSAVAHIKNDLDRVETFKSEIENIRRDLESSSDGSHHSIHYDPLPLKKEGFLSKMFRKKRPKHSRPNFFNKRHLKLNKPTFDEGYEEDFDATMMSYIPSRSNSLKAKEAIASSLALDAAKEMENEALKKKGMILGQLEDLKAANESARKKTNLRLMKERGYKSLQDLAQIEQTLKRLEHKDRASSFDHFDLSKKPHQTINGYLSGHPLHRSEPNLYPRHSNRSSHRSNTSGYSSRSDKEICLDVEGGDQVCFDEGGVYRKMYDEFMTEA